MPIKKSKPKKISVIKKDVKKKVSSINKGKLAGKVVHYFSNIKVAVLKLSAPLSVGDKVRITGGEETNFVQTVKSIEQDHKRIKKAGKGKEVGTKINKKVREGYKVYKIG